LLTYSTVPILTKWCTVRKSKNQN